MLFKYGCFAVLAFMKYSDESYGTEAVLVYSDYTPKRAMAFSHCSGQTIGVGTPSSYAFNTDTSGVGYLLEDGIYQVTCCGYISRWDVFTSATGTVKLQLWRRTGTNSYTLIGKNELTATGGLDSVVVASTDRIYVRHGDMIGWYAATNLVMHKTSSGYPATNRVSTTITDVIIGSIHDWSSERVVGSEMKFAINAILSENLPPQFTSASLVSITEETASDKNILTLTFNDDPGDTIVFSTYDNNSPYLYIDADNGQVKTSQSNIPEGSYSITPMITDSCYRTATTVITVTVTNVAIIYDGLSETSATISVDDYLEKNLTDVLITENQDGYYCYFTSSSSFPFVIRQADVLHPGYSIYLQDWPELHGGPSSYTLNIQCAEASGTSPASVSGSFSVSVAPNNGPSMALSTATVTVDAETEWVGSDVYTVVASDPEDDPLTMSLAGGGPFSITDAGRIMLTSNMIRGYSASYSLTATVTDTVSGETDSMTVAVTITNINVEPTITNTVVSFNVNENEAVGTSVFQVNAVDTDPVEYYAQYNPSYGRKLFSLNSTSGILTTSAHIDYDVINDHSFTVYVTVSDGKWYSRKTFTINILNQNETPVLGQTYYKTIRDEGLSGATFPAIIYNVDDPDIASVSDVITYTRDCGANDFRVSLNPSTGRFSFAADYDLENPTNPTDFTCTVTVTDHGGLTDTCIVDIHVEYVNEFSPVFTVSSLSATVLYTEVVGSIISSVHATDDDLSDHGIFYYELENSNNVFSILQNGSIFVSADLLPYYPNGGTFNIVVKAIDTGQRSSTVPFTVTIPATTIVAVEYTTEKPMTFYDYQMNMASYEIAALVVFSCLCMSIFLVIKYCRSKSPAVQNPQPVRPVTLPSIPNSNKDHQICDAISRHNQRGTLTSNMDSRVPTTEDEHIKVDQLFTIRGPKPTEYSSNMRSPS